tara:strand:- start:325 stop:663 length:339 start_codon:yes stop_codon:yes gene_type:complete
MMNYYVNKYEIDNCYGGPEEGGWYYTRGIFIECLAGPFSKRINAKNWKLKTFPHGISTEYKMGHGPHDGVDSDGNGDDNYLLCGGAWGQGSIKAVIEEHTGKDFPETQPYYC